MKKLLIIFPILLFFSCDKLLTEDFYITNNLNDSLYLRCENMNGVITEATIPPLIFDTIFYVNTGYGTHVSEFELIRLFKYFAIQTKDGESNKDYLDDELWEYTELSETHAAYKLVVDETHFE